MIPEEGGPARAASIRERNERLVLRMIFRDGRLSQSGAAALTGLKAPTVFRIFTELERKGLIYPDAGHRDEAAERKGRRPLYYAVVPDAACVAGVDFWAGSVAAVIQDFAGREVAYRMQGFETPPDAERAVRAIEELLSGLLAEAGVGRDKVLGIGLGAPGSVSVDTGVVHFYSRIPGLTGFPLGPRVEAAFGLPVHLHNNASIVAIAEQRYGAARGAGSLFSFLVRAGLGGAYLHGSTPLTDRGRTAFEVGHLSVDMGGQPCSCGSRGCLENILSEDAILRAVARGRPCPDLAALDALLGSGDPAVHELLAPALEAAAAAVRDIRRLLAPEAVLFVSRSEALSALLARAADGPDGLGDPGEARFSPRGGRVLGAGYDPHLACRAACDLAYEAYFQGSPARTRTDNA